MAPLTATTVLAFAIAANAQTHQTPPMGWNTYNHYGCSPSQEIVELNAQGMVDLGFADLGYTSLTVDCGWPARDRDTEGRLQWNETLFPSGGKAVGEYLHGLGLKFGLYSGAGYLQCGSTDIPASLGYEDIDAQSFAEWEGDSLKYDNCYSTSDTVMVDSSSAEAQSSARFEKMAASLSDTGRDIAYWICQWGIGTDVPEWASAIGQTWRMSNDIYNSWRSIWRITNQVVPHARASRPGAFADMDMLIIGLGALSYEEERFHFGMWSIMKSPLLIGALMDATVTPQESLDILRNSEVIALNQDALGEAADLVIRYTEEEWDVWAGNLSEGRKIVGVANWRNESQTVEFDLALVGVGTADARDVWVATDIGSVSGMQSVELAGHELKLLLLSNIEETALPTSEGYYSAPSAALTSPASLTTCSSDECLPVGYKIGNVIDSAVASFGDISSSSAGVKLVGVDYINYDYAFETSWEFGSNTRNMTISVNGGTAKRWAFPLAGNDWYETGRLVVEVDGFEEGDGNEISFAAVDGYAPDLVGVEILSV